MLFDVQSKEKETAPKEDQYDAFDYSLLVDRRCAIYNENIVLGGAWDTYGVQTVDYDDNTALCIATRTGTFAIVGEYDSGPVHQEEKAWESFQKTIGYSASAILLAFIAYAAVMSKKKSTYEMYDILSVHLSCTQLFCTWMKIFSEMNLIRKDHMACALNGLLMEYGFTTFAFQLMLLCFAVFR